jgi:hypothetical protein
VRTCSAHCRVAGSGHPLNGGLGGYYQVKLPHVPWATSYGPNHLDMTGSLQRYMARGPYTMNQEVTLPLRDEEMGPPT